MKHRVALVALWLAACGAASGLSAAEPRFTPAREVAVKELTLPTSDPGYVIVTCARCVTVNYLTTFDTEYRIGDQKVTLNELRQHLASLPADEAVLVHVAPDRRHVLLVSAPVGRVSK